MVPAHTTGGALGEKRRRVGLRGGVRGARAEALAGPRVGGVVLVGEKRPLGWWWLRCLVTVVGLQWQKRVCVCK